MPRKPKTSIFEDVVEIVAKMPWWVGVILAVVSYMVLHVLAIPDANKPTDIQQLGQYGARLLWKTFAFFMQFFIPPLFLLGAALSAWRRRKRADIFNGIVVSDAADSLDGMSWHEFEMLVGEAFRLDGFQVEERATGGADGGVDLVLTQGNEKFFVQCKQWKAFKVGVNVVRELYGVMAAHGAAGGFTVTSGTFTKDAIEFAAGRNVILVDGPILLDMIKQAKRAPTTQGVLSTKNGSPFSAPQCPQCASKMVERAAKRGTNVGSKFWGCSRYPDCKGTRAVE